MIENTLFILLWFLLPVLWFIMLKTTGLSLRKLTIPSFVLAAIMVFQYIGLPILYFMLDDYRAQYVTDKYIIIQVFFYTSITITLMIIGFIAAKSFFGKLSWNIPDNRPTGSKKKFILSLRISRLNLGVVFFSIISFAVLALYLAKINDIALFVALSGSGDADMARSSMGNAFAGKYHRYKVFMNDILVFLTLVAYGNYLIKKTFSNKALFSALFIAASFVMTMAIEKGPMAWLLIGLFLVYVITRNKGNFPIKSIFFVSTILLIVMIGFYVFFMGAPNVGGAVNSIFSRLFTGQIQPAYHYLEYFNEHDFLMGESFPNPGGMFPFKNFALTKELYALVFPEHVARGIVGSMPTIFWGDMYANFGISGVIIPPFFVGFGLYWLNVIIFRLKYSPLSIALYVWLAIHFKNLAFTSLTTYMLDTYMIMVILIFVVLSFFVGNGKFCFSKKYTQKYHSSAFLSFN